MCQGVSEPRERANKGHRHESAARMLFTAIVVGQGATFLVVSFHATYEGILGARRALKVLRRAPPVANGEVMT